MYNFTNLLKSLNREQFYIKKKLNSKISKKQLLKPSKVILYVDTCNGLRVDMHTFVCTSSMLLEL